MHQKRWLALCLALLMLLFAGCSAAQNEIEPPETGGQEETQLPDSSTPDEKPDDEASPPVQTPETPPEEETPSTPSEEKPAEPTEEPQKPTVNPVEPPESPPEEETPPAGPEPSEQENTVAITITTPEGALLSAYHVAVTEDSTVLSVTREACKTEGINMVTTGADSIAYIKSMGGYKEFQEGPLSGWLYSVNGTRASKSCGAYQLEAGDTVEWTFSLDGK